MDDKIRAADSSSKVNRLRTLDLVELGNGGKSAVDSENNSSSSEKGVEVAAEGRGDLSDFSVKLRSLNERYGLERYGTKFEREGCNVYRNLLEPSKTIETT